MYINVFKKKMQLDINVIKNEFQFTHCLFTLQNYVWFQVNHISFVESYVKCLCGSTYIFKIGFKLRIKLQK